MLVNACLQQRYCLLLPSVARSWKHAVLATCVHTNQAQSYCSTKNCFKYALVKCCSIQSDSTQAVRTEWTPRAVPHFNMRLPGDFCVLFLTKCTMCLASPSTSFFLVDKCVNNCAAKVYITATQRATHSVKNVNCAIFCHLRRQNSWSNPSTGNNDNTDKNRFDMRGGHPANWIYPVLSGP